MYCLRRCFWLWGLLPAAQGNRRNRRRLGPKTESAAPSVKKGGKVLVVYFSGTGHTRSVAKTIAEAVHGDLWELQPVQPYTEADLNYRDKSSRVVKEHDNPSLQEQVALTNAKPANWDTYSTVFIGYPIWWHLAAWPVKGFVKANAFSGKTVIPFATSVESGMGEAAPNCSSWPVPAPGWKGNASLQCGCQRRSGLGLQPGPITVVWV